MFEKEIETFKEEYKKEIIEEIVKFIDEIENKHINTTMDEWKLYKRIRNSIRDKYLK